MSAAASNGVVWSQPLPEAFATGFALCSATRFKEQLFYPDSDTLIEEVPVSLEINGSSSIVLMATPTELEELALGFLLTEGILDHPGQVIELDAVPTSRGVGVFISLPGPLLGRVEARRRAGQVSSSCSMCGLSEMSEALCAPAVKPSSLKVTPAAIEKAFGALPSHQLIGSKTGAAHAAAFTDAEGNILAVAEDVGRHNAIDKLVGKLANASIDPSSGFCALTSRASVEMIQKAARAGFPMVCAISAPTALAVRLAHRSGVTLCAFARGSRFVCFSHAARISAACGIEQSPLSAPDDSAFSSSR